MENKNIIVGTENLSKKYNDIYRVENVNLKIFSQEIYGFLGPNGAGKSTTMKMLLGLVHPTDGKVNILGKPFNSANRISILKNVGSLIESPSYYGHLTGRENMEVLRRLLDLSKKNIDEAIHIVRLENQMNKKVKHYSLGMKQRLGIAMAIARFPKLLILDEPTNGLDPAGIEEIRDLIKELPKQYGMTVMISSHLLSEIEQTATAIGIINHGKMIFQDKMEVLNQKRRPRLLLRTSNNALAKEVLKNFQMENGQNGIILPLLEDEEVGNIVYTLYQNNIRLYRIEEQKNSLEDVFLELTGKEVAL